MAHYPATGLLMTTPRFSLVHRTAVGSAAQALVLSGCQPTHGNGAPCLAPPLTYHHFPASTNSLAGFELSHPYDENHSSLNLRPIHGIQYP
jgi:hypothetical protein